MLDRSVGRSMSFEDKYEALLARRIPLEQIEIGKAYVIHARNGGVGIAVHQNERLGYRLHREKFGDHYLFVEIDWQEDPQFGTAIPLAAIVAVPPLEEERLLEWLRDQEAAHRADIDRAWELILGRPLPKGTVA